MQHHQDSHQEKAFGADQGRIQDFKGRRISSLILISAMPLHVNLEDATPENHDCMCRSMHKTIICGIFRGTLRLISSVNGILTRIRGEIGEDLKL
ncbi:hypothetical protein F511_22745 [Dorcoceras hygrometricum]|uniref:Uncharacterized protein n=1 Tax=Dorcoceras hygrometricum TaxID=472368 RepID=A0A2Z7C237_9LAMI|nr:hypothetical protein F511_22745 [Dorcoceras hygrometricum]